MAENLNKTHLSYADVNVVLNALKTYLDNEFAKAGGNTEEVAEKLNTLIGSVAGDDAKSVRTISAEEVAKIVAGADEKYDTLKEIADFILSDTTGAAKMAADIATLMGEDEGSVKKALQDAKDYADGLKTEIETKYGDWATEAQVQALCDIFKVEEETEEEGENA